MEFIIYNAVRLDLALTVGDDFTGAYEAMTEEFGYNEELKALGLHNDQEIKDFFEDYRNRNK